MRAAYLLLGAALGYLAARLLRFFLADPDPQHLRWRVVDPASDRSRCGLQGCVGHIDLDPQEDS